MFLPLGARAGIDAALADTQMEKGEAPPGSNQHLSWASAGLLLQVLSVYFFSALLKSGGEWWPDGSAVDYAMQIDAYATPVGRWLRNFPGFEQDLTYWVFFLEMIGPLVALSPVLNRPLRFIVMLALMLMHIGFIVCLNIGPFPFVSLASLSALAGGWIWDRAAARLQRPRPAPLRLYYDGDCGFCLRSVRILRELLVLPQLQLAPAQSLPRARTLMEANDSWVLIDHDDHAYLKWPAFVQLLRRSPLWGWAGWLLAGGRGRWAVRPGDAVYAFVARHRRQLGPVSAALLPYRTPRFAAGRAGQTFAAFMLVMLLGWNLCTVGALPRALYSALTPPLRLLRIDQMWDMFAPFPAKEDGWWVIPAELSDGREIDLRHPQRGAVDYSKPADVSAEFENIRWHKYLERLWAPQFSANRPYYARYLCRSWNAEHDAGERIKSLKLVYMLELSVPEGQTSTIEQRVVLRQDCAVGIPAPATN